MQLKHIMLDLETLSTRTAGVIVSIGAVRFDLATGTIDDKAFYRSVSVDSNTRAGRHISESTICWWLEQSKAAKGVFTEDKVHLLDALNDLTGFIGTDNCQVWSCGADFDIPMLAHAYHSFDLGTPWKFFNANCYRTYKKLPGAPKMVTPASIRHNALLDAYAQAVHVCEIHSALFLRNNMKASTI